MPERERERERVILPTLIIAVYVQGGRTDTITMTSTYNAVAATFINVGVWLIAETFLAACSLQIPFRLIFDTYGCLSHYFYVPGC